MPAAVIRNITATPTTGFDPTELIDVMPYARAMHHYILKNRDLYGLPRKFNISFDSGGRVSVCADTNDIGFHAVRVGPNGHGIAKGNLQAAITALQATGLDHRYNTLTGGLIACTGSRGCKFAAADTQGDAIMLGEHLTREMILDQPVNIHLTGCQNSCAQHYIGDFGMMGTRVKADDGGTVDGYNIALGRGVDDTQAIAREIWKSIRADEMSALIEQLPVVYLRDRIEDESFTRFANRHTPEQLMDLCDPAKTAAA